MTRHALAVALALVGGACVSTNGSLVTRTPQTPLDLRQAQSRTFTTSDSRLVLKAALNLLQDEGFVIREANADLGLVTAVMERHSTNQGLRAVKWAAILSTYGVAALLPWHDSAVTSVEANVNVTPEARGSRVRVSLVTKTLDKHGNVQKVEPVTDAMAYQRLLADLDKGVYLQREGL
jgi:hypothetical protein